MGVLHVMIDAALDFNAKKWSMSIRKYFLLSLLFAVLAVGLEMASMSQRTQGARIRVRAVVSAETDRTAAALTADAYRARGTAISLLGLVLAVSSLLLVVTSARKHEPAWRSITVAWIIFYGMLQFAVI